MFVSLMKHDKHISFKQQYITHLMPTELQLTEKKKQSLWQFYLAVIYKSRETKALCHLCSGSYSNRL